jgi:hypothetical protein
LGETAGSAAQLLINSSAIVVAEILTLQLLKVRIERLARRSSAICST